MAEILLSAFLDECTRPRPSDGRHVIATVADQLMAGQALGLSRWVPRWFNFSTLELPDIVNVGKLSDGQLREVLAVQRAYGFTAHCMGSGIGKGVKLVDVEDGSQNVYWEPQRYLDEVVQPAAAIAEKLGVRSVRLFSFHHPRGSDSHSYVGQAVERLAPIVEVFKDKRILPLLEIEAGLVGDRGVTCLDILDQLHAGSTLPPLLLIWDWGNVYSQGLDLWYEWRVMQSGVGEFHAKFYDGPRPDGFGPINEDALSHYVPASVCSGQSRCEPVFADLLDHYDDYQRRLGPFFSWFDLTIVLEPHLLGGGKYGGKSGAIGMGVALRSLCRVLDHVGFTYHLRDHDDVIEAREALTRLERGS